jgi:hypothetical protein
MMGFPSLLSWPYLKKVFTEFFPNSSHLRRKTAMKWYDERRSQQRNLCSFAYTCAQIAEQTIFARITDSTTPDQFMVAQQNLLALCQRLESQMDMFHYPAASGLHHCVQDIYTEAAFRLENLAIMQPPAPPAPKQQLLSREGAVIDLEKQVETSTEETNLGTDDSPFDDWDNQ